MREIVLAIPKWEEDQNLEIEVRVNGKKKKLCYKVEIVSWDDDEATSDTKVQAMRHVIEEHEKDWELIQIGAPNKDKIPIMFRKKSENGGYTNDC